MHNDWHAIGHTLQALSGRMAELGAAPDPRWKALPLGELATEMRLAEARERPVCDAIMRGLLRSAAGAGRPTALQALFCSMRCHCALDTLGILHAPLNERPLYPRPPAWPDADLLEWLLVSNWGQRHDTWLKLCAFAGHTGRGFYSG